MLVQIKLNGQRVEAGEVEAVMRQVHGVDEAVLQIKTTAAATMQLVAYVVPAAVSVDIVEERCREALPAYMVPSLIVPLECWPLNPYGKINRKALAALVNTPAESSLQTVWTDDRQRQVAQACERILGLAAGALMADTNLLAVGLTSLLAAACAAEFQKVGLEGLSAAAVLKSPSVRALALLVGESSGVASQISCCALAESEAGAQLSSQQQQMWIMYEIDPLSVSYTSPGAAGVFVCFTACSTACRR